MFVGVDGYEGGWVAVAADESALLHDRAESQVRFGIVPHPVILCADSGRLPARRTGGTVVATGPRITVPTDVTPCVQHPRSF